MNYLIPTNYVHKVHQRNLHHVLASVQNIKGWNTIEPILKVKILLMMNCTNRSVGMKGHYIEQIFKGDSNYKI